MTKQCLFCKKEFIKPFDLSKKRWVNRKFCTSTCYNSFQKGQIRKEKLSYGGAHSWIRKQPKPNICSHCGILSPVAKDGRSELHWANKSGKYLRDISDWLCLCRSCHCKFDKPWLKRAIINGTFA